MKQKKISGLNIKDKIRTDLFPRIATSLNAFGVPWQKLGRSKIGSSTLIAQGRKIAETVRPQKIEKPLNIYFLTMLGGHTHNVSVDIALGWGLKQKGHKVHFILDDYSLPINEEKKAGEEHRWKELSAKSYNFGYKYLTACGFGVLGISEIVNLQQDRNISDFSSIIEAGLLKHFKVGVITDTVPGVKEKKKLLEESARISALVGDFLVKQNPDRVIMSHGIYPTWGPPFQILIENNIPVLTYSKTKRKKTEKFNWNTTGDWWDVSKEWEKVKNIPLNVGQQKKINHYLKTRITHSEDVMVYNFGALEDRDKTLKRFNLDPEKLTFSLFTNVLWDAASAHREIAFKNPIEWVFETIKWFASQPEKQLIVKIHPAEVVIGTNQPFADLIKKQIPKLPPNVCLIKPNEEVNSWSIYKVTDLGIIHTTTAGMELPLLGVPCVVVSKTHFRDKGFTIDIDSKESYFNYLNNFKKENIESENLKIIAERYAYLLFERYQVPFDLFDEVKWTDVRSWKFDSINELFQIDFFKDIIDSIINKKEFLTEV
ncbi:MAG: hypothetical protein ABI419_05505 [Ginsengibacter sp.]